MTTTTLTAEMLGRLDEYCGQREDADRETCAVGTDELRALIDAARWRMAMESPVYLLGNVELLGEPGRIVAYEPAVNRHAAYELVERELRAAGVYRVLLMGPPDDGRDFVEVGTGITADHGESWGEADTLLAAVEAAKKRGGR